MPAAAAGRVHLPVWKPPAELDATAYLEAAERVLAGQLELFGRWSAAGGAETDWNRDFASGTVAPLVPGDRLDYRDARQVGSARNIWEVNRHFQLVTLAQAYALNGDDKYREAALGALSSWIRACPYPLGINWVSALEHGIRLINWYLAARLLRCSEADVRAVPGWLDSIYRHCDFIWRKRSRYSSANNHLIGEMAGLYIAATAWPCWPRSSRWRSAAKRSLEAEARRQVHPDGVTREQTVGYQLFVLQFLLIAGLAGEAVGDPFSARYWSVVQRMLCFLGSIRDRNGHWPEFGDSDDGIVFLLAPGARATRADDLIELGAEFSTPDGSDIRARGGSSGALRSGGRGPASAAGTGAVAAWLDSGFPRPANWPSEPLARRQCFPEGGYYILGGRFGEADEVSLVFDAAPLGYLSIAAHGHADCLSFTLSLGGEPMLVDPGTYCYHDDAQWRDYFRSTRAHNTLSVDGADQSQVGGPFMWLTKAKPRLESFEIRGERQFIRASHNGYRRLDDPVTHTRELLLDAEAKAVQVFDEVTARRRHVLRRFWHFSEYCDVRRLSDHAVVVRAPGAELRLEVDAGSELTIYRGSKEPRAGWVSPRFGELREAATVCVTDVTHGPATLRARLSWRV